MKIETRNIDIPNSQDIANAHQVTLTKEGQKKLEALIRSAAELAPLKDDFAARWAEGRLCGTDRKLLEALGESAERMAADGDPGWVEVGRFIRKSMNVFRTK